MNKSFGSIYQLKDAVEERIDELGGFEDVNSTEDIELEGVKAEEVEEIEGRCVKSSENVSVRQCKAAECIEECDDVSEQFGIVTC